MLVLLMLTGCATHPVAVVGAGTTQTTASPASGKPMDQAKQKVEIDPYLLEDCTQLQPMTLDNPTPNQVLEQHALDVATMRACFKRHHSLIQIVKDAFNVK